MYQKISKKFLHKKGISRFCVEIFCLTGPKNFVRGPFCFTKFLVSKKFMDKRGEYHDFLSKIFPLTVPKIFVSFSVSLISGVEKC